MVTCRSAVPQELWQIHTQVKEKYICFDHFISMYLEDVTFKKQHVPFRHYNDGVGSCVQAK